MVFKRNGGTLMFLLLIIAFSHTEILTTPVETCYNMDLGTITITLLYQDKKAKKNKEMG